MATVELLRNSQLFKDLSNEELRRLLANMKEIHFQPNEVILTQNEPAQAVYVLTSGSIKILVDGEIVAQVDTPQCFGEMSCATPDTPASATVMTTGRCVMLSIRRDDFLRVLEDVPQFWRSLFLQSSDRLKRLTKRQSEILEHSPQGFMKLDKTARVTNEYSAKCARYFSSDDLAGRSFPGLLYPNEPAQRASWQETYAWLFEDSLLEFQDLSNLLTLEVSLPSEQGERQYLLSYHPSRDIDGQLVAVDVGMEDVTEQRHLERVNAALTEQKEVLGKIYQNPEVFFTSIGMLDKTISEVSDLGLQLTQESPVRLALRFEDAMRKLHSLKGFAGMYSLKPVQERAHALETLIREIESKPTFDEDSKAAFQDAIHLLQQESVALESLMERMGSPLRQRLMGVVVAERELAFLREAVNQSDTQRANGIMDRIESMDAAQLFMAWDSEVEKLCALLNKKARFEPVTQSVKIPKASFLALGQVVPHLLFNGMAHGIEFPEIREFSGKSAVGTLSVQLVEQGELLDIQVRDDGKGLDFDTLPEIARHKPQLDQALVAQHARNGEAWRILLMPGFSTAEQVTTLAGRGVGLDAIQSSVLALGGKILIESTPGQGMVFHLYIPLEPTRTAHVSQ